MHVGDRRGVVVGGRGAGVALRHGRPAPGRGGRVEPARAAVGVASGRSVGGPGRVGAVVVRDRRRRVRDRARPVPPVPGRGPRSGDPATTTPVGGVHRVGTCGPVGGEPLRAARRAGRPRDRIEPRVGAPRDARPPAAAVPGTGAGPGSSPQLAAGGRPLPTSDGRPASDGRGSSHADRGDAARRLVGARRARVGRLVGLGSGGEHRAGAAARAGRGAAFPHRVDRPTLAWHRCRRGPGRHRVDPVRPPQLGARVRVGGRRLGALLGRCSRRRGCGPGRRRSATPDGGRATDRR